MKSGSPGLSRRLVLLDLAGRVREERELVGPTSLSGSLEQLLLWIADLDGDGFDEICFVTDALDRFTVTRDGLKQEAWDRDLARGEHVYAVRSAARGKSGVVLLKSDTAFRGYDGKTGVPVWACDGPWPGAWLPPADPSALPIFVYPTGQHGTIARRAVPTTPDGKFLVPEVK